MKTFRIFNSLLAAALTSAAALASAFGTGKILQRSAALHSHQKPMTEHLFEPSAPSSPAIIAHGRSLFLDSCAHCHGADASGDEGPDLHNAQVSDRYISAIITHGIPHEMPSFAKKLGAPEISELTAYIRSLETN